MKLAILLSMAMASFAALADSPKSIQYRKSFDQIGNMSFSQKMGFKSFEITKEEIFPIGREYFCKTTLRPRPNKAAALVTSASQFQLAEVVTMSPYTYCKKLPDFASITDESRPDKAAQTILMKYVDGREKVIIKLYGNKRVEIFDKSRDLKFIGKVIETF